MKLDPSEFPLSRFKTGDVVVIWKGSDSVSWTGAHGKKGTVCGSNYVEIDIGGKVRVYYDSNACFMTEEEFAVFDVMGS